MISYARILGDVYTSPLVQPASAAKEQLLALPGWTNDHEQLCLPKT